MTANRDDTDRPMAEPATEQSGNEVGGMRVASDRGIGDATQRTMEHDDASPLGRASTGDASGGASDPRLDLGGTNAPGAAATPSAAPDRPAADDAASVGGSTSGSAAPGSGGFDDDGEQWRHEPRAPVDEKNPLKSLGRAVADTLTSGQEDTSGAPKD